MGAYDRIDDLQADARWGCANPTKTDMGSGAWDYVQDERRWEAERNAEDIIADGLRRQRWLSAAKQGTRIAWDSLSADQQRQLLAALDTLQGRGRRESRTVASR